MNERIINLYDEKGNQMQYELLDVVNYSNDIYAVLYPITSSDTEVTILKVKKSNIPDKSVYEVETDNIILQIVYEKFKNKNKGKINFIN